MQRDGQGQVKKVRDSGTVPGGASAVTIDLDQEVVSSSGGSSSSSGSSSESEVEEGQIGMTTRRLVNNRPAQLRNLATRK